MTTAKTVRNVVFLTGTFLWVGFELWQAMDGDGYTRPWTDYLTDLPGWLLLPVVAVFCVWLPWHLWGAYQAKRSKENEDV